MAVFTTKTFQKQDDWMTPKYAWENIAHLIPKDKKIWEPFYGDGKSGDYLREVLGGDIEIVHKNEDFFKVNYPDTIVVSNPESIKKNDYILTRKPIYICLMRFGVVCVKRRNLFIKSFRLDQDKKI